MFLKNVEITNFKCFDHLFVDFSTGDGKKHPVRKITFLTGENGTGKSALLQAIALVTGGSEALYAVPGLPNAFIKAGQPFTEIKATIVTAQGEERLLSLRMNRDAYMNEIMTDARLSLFPIDAALSYTHRSYFTAGYGSGRHTDTTHHSYNGAEHRSPRYLAVHSLFNNNSLLRPLNEWTYAAQYGGGTVEECVQALKEALAIFLPPEVQFQGLSKVGQFLFETPDGVLPLEALSNGYQQTVSWVSNLLHHVTRTFGDYKNPLSARGLLLIDEIDLHLHPAWQQQLHSSLAKGLSNFQIMATTNSPLTAQQAAANELFTLQRQNDHSIQLISAVQQPLPTQEEQVAGLDTATKQVIAPMGSTPENRIPSTQKERPVAA